MSARPRTPACRSRRARRTGRGGRPDGTSPLTDGTLSLVAAQFADGAGAKFHLVALSLYVLHHGGLGAVSGFIASGLLGSVVAVAAAAGTTRVISGRMLMASAAVTLLAARIVAYVVIAAGAGAVWLFVGQFVGSVAGTLLINCSKAQAPPGRRARTLAWMNVSNGAGGIVGAGSAAATVGRFERLTERVPATVLWPATGVVPVALWGLAPTSLGVLLAAVAFGALMLGWMAVSVEAAIVERTGSAATSVLSLSTAVAALLSAGTVQAVPRLLERSGHPATSGVLLVGLFTVAIAATTLVFPGRRRSRRTRVAPAGKHELEPAVPHELARAVLPTYSSAAP